MPSRISPLKRLALFIAWDEKCVWCGRPLSYSGLELDHLIPKSLAETPTVLEEVLRLHGVPLDFDLLSVKNLVPSCAPCNREKGKRVPPHAPAITLSLQRAGELEPQIEELTAKLQGRRKLDEAIAVLELNIQDDNLIRAVHQAVTVVLDEVFSATGEKVTRVHPDFVAVLPDLAQEMETALLAQGEPELAMQVSSLKVVRPCACDDSFCQSFYTISKAEKKNLSDTGRRTIVVGVDYGSTMLVLDVIESQVVFVEVLHL